MFVCGERSCIDYRGNGLSHNIYVHADNGGMLLAGVV